MPSSWPLEALPSAPAVPGIVSDCTERASNFQYGVDSSTFGTNCPPFGGSTSQSSVTVLVESAAARAAPEKPPEKSALANWCDPVWGEPDGDCTSPAAPPAALRRVSSRSANRKLNASMGTLSDRLMAQTTFWSSVGAVRLAAPFAPSTPISSSNVGASSALSFVPCRGGIWCTEMHTGSTGPSSPPLPSCWSSPAPLSPPASVPFTDSDCRLDASVPPFNSGHRGERRRSVAKRAAVICSCDSCMPVVAPSPTSAAVESSPPPLPSPCGTALPCSGCC